MVDCQSPGDLELGEPVSEYGGASAMRREAELRRSAAEAPSRERTVGQSHLARADDER
jgi:hypothetical protein